METVLFFHKAGEPIPSNYTAYGDVLSAVRKDKTHRWSRQNLTLQRSGLAAGLEAVRKWSKHKRNLDNNLDYWTGRAEKDPDDPKVLRKRSVAEQKLSKHREAGTKRLFRRRREEEACSGAALVYGERARLIATGRGYAIRLPGGLVLSLREKGFDLPEGHSFTGAVQVVDITDIKGRVTRRTLPEHRTYNIHLSCTMGALAPKEVENEFDILGVDLGMDHPAYRSDGISHSMPKEKVMQKDIKATQRRRARCQEGSRRWRKRNREVAALSRKKSNRRNHNAKAIATSGHYMVSAEDLQAKNMSSTAKGTIEHPGTRVAQKRGLNRSLQQVGVRAMLDAIERACQKNGTDFLESPSLLHITDLLPMRRDRQTREASVCLYELPRCIPSGFQRSTQPEESGIPDNTGGGQARSSKNARPQPRQGMRHEQAFSNAPAPGPAIRIATTERPLLFVPVIGIGVQTCGN